MAVIDNGIYVAGRRATTPPDLDDGFEALDAGAGMAWIDLMRPDEAELAAIAQEFDLHPLAIEDASKGHQRAKLERYGDTLFVVLRPAWYHEDVEIVEFGEVHLFVGPRFVITVRHTDRCDLSPVRRRLEAAPQLLAKGPLAVLAAVMDEVVDGYAPVATAVERDIDEIEDDLFDGEVVPESSKRIYQLLSEVIDFQRAISPVRHMLESLLRGGFRGSRYTSDFDASGPHAGNHAPGHEDDEWDENRSRDISGNGARRTANGERAASRDDASNTGEASNPDAIDEEVSNQLRNVLDHGIRVTERADTFRTLLENALVLHSTLVSQEQNDAMRRMSVASLAQGEESRALAQASMAQGEEVKKISSWAAILFTPTLVASIYGMNFDHMPELHWVFGYPFALTMMVVCGFGLWWVFKRRRWL